MRNRDMNASFTGVRKNSPCHLKRNKSSLSGALLPMAFSTSCSYASSGCNSRLMRSSRIKSSFAAGAGSTSLNFCPRAAAPANKPFKYSFCSAVKPALMRGSGKVEFILIHVPLIAFVGFQFRHVGLRFVGALAADGLRDLVQCRVHVLRHTTRIAADVEVSARF